jgi:hypothetical protein
MSPGENVAAILLTPCYRIRIVGSSVLVDMHLETRILFSLYWLSSGFEADSG